MIHKGMLRTSTIKNSVVLRSGLSQTRRFSTKTTAFQKTEANSQVPQVNGKKLTPQEAKMEAAKLALSSLKDMGSLFSSGNDDATQPIDTAPVFENPYIFGSLNVIQQDQVIKELQEKYDKKWTKLSENDKKLGYYIAYGNWGVRENFEKWDTHEAPWDLPFTIPSKIRKVDPKPEDKINKLEPVYLAETEVRKAQFDIKKMDPVTKTFIYITLFVILLALARDKKIGEEGKPEEYVTVDQYAKQREEEQRKAEEAKQAEIAKANARKWYYLWLK